jgi:DNA repair exonuclease SbcCD nuclease subunit
MITNLKHLAFSGDWHGKWNKAISKIKELDIRDCAIVQVGDFGAGFDHPKKFEGSMKMLNSTLKPRNLEVFAIRGNHDDPAYFDGRRYGNVTLLSDYTVLTHEHTQKHILCVGGAISLDRLPNPDVVDYRGRPWKGRKEGANYWKDESFVLRNELVPSHQVDVVATHSAPDFCYPIFKSKLDNWAKHDATLKEDVELERSQLAELRKITSPSAWYYGHYHESKFEYLDDGTKYVLLDELEFKIYGNTGF